MAEIEAAIGAVRPASPKSCARGLVAAIVSAEEESEEGAN
jgi:hypothetical protein